MKIGTKYIIINKNIKLVQNDLTKLTGNSRLEDFSNKLEIFYGEINGRFFKFYCENKNYSRLATPELQGEIFERNNNKTLIKVNIFVPFLHIILNIFWIIFAVYEIIIPIITKWKNNNIFLNILLIIISFIYPIMDCGYYFYNLKNMLDDFYLYDEGYYDKYIK
jgi:hypothetical protein